jgi:hypothetical protein
MFNYDAAFHLHELSEMHPVWSYRMAGYSGTPLPKKLGIKPGHRLALINAAEGFLAGLGDLPEGVEIVAEPRGGEQLDVIVYFTTDRADLKRRFKGLAKRMVPAAGLWIAWPKRASGVPTDLTEDIIRAVGLEAGLVDNKVCAIDDTWSGLRFVIRVQDRPKPRR